MADLSAKEKVADVATAIEGDAELQAMRDVLVALVPLNLEGRARVLGYVLGRLGMTGEAERSAPTSPGYAPVGAEKPPQISESGIKDIRSLKEKKAPRSANEMAAVVAYYLAELAPERRQSISADDIKQYFLEARFPLPNNLQQLLVNAKNAGYLQSVGTGQYRLNSVGYNLVMHKLPTPSMTPAIVGRQRGRPRKTKPTKKTPRK